jgi:hypothetical protein
MAFADEADRFMAGITSLVQERPLTPMFNASLGSCHFNAPRPRRNAISMRAEKIRSAWAPDEFNRRRDQARRSQLWLLGIVAAQSVHAVG